MKKNELGSSEELVRTSKRARTAFRELVEVLSNLDVNAGTSYGTGVVLENERVAWADLLPTMKDVLEQKTLAAAESDVLHGSRYAAELRRMLELRGLEVLGDDVMPVINGIAQLVLDARRGLVLLNDAVVSDTRLAAVVDLIEHHVKTLLAERSEPVKFLSELRRAYLWELALTSKQEGAQVETLALLRHIILTRQSNGFLRDPRSKSFREYPLINFRVDLSLLIASNERTVDGHEFRYSSGANTTGAVFLFDRNLGRPTYLARIWFE